MGTNDNMRFWDKLKKPPTNMLKKITYGAMKGKSSIDPVWRMEVMTDTFGPVGIGWNYEITDREVYPVSEGQSIAFVSVRMWVVTEDGAKSYPFDGTGSSFITSIVNRGKSDQYVKTNDEAFKMATTDALSVCFKAVGVAAEIYKGNFDGVKYFNQEEPEAPTTITDEQLANIEALMTEVNADYKKFCQFLDVSEIHNIPVDKYNFAVMCLEKKRGE